MPQLASALCSVAEDAQETKAALTDVSPEDVAIPSDIGRGRCGIWSTLGAWLKECSRSSTDAIGTIHVCACDLSAQHGLSNVFFCVGKSSQLRSQGRADS